MNPEKISNFIKNSRKKSHLTQQQFGDKYGVTYQAVSKWETGKSIPDIAVLKEICTDYQMDINTLLETNTKTHFSQKTKRIILIVLVLLLFSFLLYQNSHSSFQFKTIQTTCDNFRLYGSIAYNKNKTSIYISNITYCGKGKEQLEKYLKITCTLYEVDQDSKRKIDAFSYQKEITLEDFLKKVNFNVDHFSKNCKMYKENGLLLEIKATNSNQETKLYEIPLKLLENCKN